MRLYVPVQIITYLCTSFDVSRVINYFSTPAAGLMNGVLVLSWHTWQFSRSRRRERGLWSHLIKSAAVIYTNPDRCSPPQHHYVGDEHTH